MNAGVENGDTLHKVVFCDTNSVREQVSLPLLALSGQSDRAHVCPLLGEQRTDLDFGL
jgi:hypothetical protein